MWDMAASPEEQALRDAVDLLNVLASANAASCRLGAGQPLPKCSDLAAELRACAQVQIGAVLAAARAWRKSLK